MFEQKYEMWKQNVNEVERTELENLSPEQVKTIFSNQLTFGTGGVRAVMGTGPSLLNKYTIGQITNGYIEYLKTKYEMPIRVVIGHDSRHNGQFFTQVCINLLRAADIEVYTFSELMATPVVSYMIRKFDAQGAIILTASHNPKEYNGYKVYNHTGAQLNLAEAEELIGHVNDQPVNFELSDSDVAPTHMITENELEQYIEDIKTVNDLDKDLKIVFTPIHGTTYKLIPKALRASGYSNVIEVEEQMTPDGDFPTTISANPEEAAAFDYAKQYLVNNNADLAIATDPDGDRIGIVMNENGNVVPFTGNETGALLINYLIASGQHKPNSIIYKTIVTGDLGASIAKDNHIAVEETLTGFKFIGEKIELEKERDFLFGYEESYGYLFNPKVRDKDSVQSAVQIANMVAYYKGQGMTLTMALESLKRNYGYYQEQTFSYVCDDLSTIESVMDTVRKYDGEIFGYQTSRVVDYAIDETGLPQADVVKFYIDQLGWIVFRPSGTEPKIKAYVSVKTETNEKSVAIMNEIHRQLDLLVENN